MSGIGAKICLVGSSALLLGAALTWAFGGMGEGRSDLVGAEVASRPSPPESGQKTQVRPPSPVPIVSQRIRPAVVASQPSDSSVTKENSRPEQDPQPPVRILIPGISVDAAVVSVGVEANGSMEVPDETAAGWFEPGARPGAQTGSAVLAGHVDHANAPGVFFDLRRVSVGDAIELLDETGTQHRYTVTERFQVDKDDLPAAELFRRTGPPVLTLITCAGSFDRKNRTYSDNIVIRASPAGLASLRPF